MKLLRIAEDLDGIADQAESKELDEVMASCGITSDDETGTDNIFDESGTGDGDADDALIARAANARDDFDISGINSTDQDEFNEVQNAVGFKDQADYSSVANAAKKYAACARKLAKIEEACKTDKANAKYMPYVAAMQRKLASQVEILRKAVADKTEGAPDVGHDGPRPEKEYGAYDKNVKPAMDSEITSTNAPWKTDGHDEMGYGIPKTQNEVTREAALKTAAIKSIRLAVCLLGSKAPEDMIEAQGRDFFASLKLSAIDRALKRYAETQGLYDAPAGADAVKDAPVENVAAATKPVEQVTTDMPVEPMATKPMEETVAAEVVPEPLAPQDPTKTVENVAAEVSPIEEKSVPEAPAAIENVAAADAPFSPEEEKQCEELKAAIVARKAKIMSEAKARAAKVLAASEDAEEKQEEENKEPALPPMTDEVKAAVEDGTAAPVIPEVPAVPEAPVTPVADDGMDGFDFGGGGNEADAVADPELEACFGGGMESKTASAEVPAKKCVQSLTGMPKMASVKDVDELAQCWAKPGEEFFN